MLKWLRGGILEVTYRTVAADKDNRITHNVEENRYDNVIYVCSVARMNI